MVGNRLGKRQTLWRAVDHEGEVLEVIATKRRDRKAAVKFLKRMWNVLRLALFVILM